MSDGTNSGNTATSGGGDPATRVDVQDPLPENNWLWRRTYVFVFSLLSTAAIWFGLEALNGLQDAASIFLLTRWMIWVHLTLIVFYMLAPSAEQIVKVIQTARLLKSGVTISRSATVDDAQGRTEVQTTAGTPAPPYAPEIAPEPVFEQDAAPSPRN